jgi:hypothetical protein
MSGSQRYYWVPGNARHDRGYTLEEALVAVGPGWAPLVAEAWRAVTEAGGGVIQVKEKWNMLRVYFLAPPDHTDRLERTMDALEERSAEMDQGRREWAEVERFQEWIPWQGPGDRPEWWREAVGEALFGPRNIEEADQENGDRNDRFGTPDSAFEAALESHGRDNPFVRMGMYVPTRHEVATMDPGELFEILDGWLNESPSELIPSRAQVQEVRAVLADRPDAESQAVQEILALCDEVLNWEGP